MKSNYIKLRATDEEKAKWKKKAAKVGLTLSSWVRLLIAKEK
jgi:antitoxin component of RelBE/YafQ-DinJ toxin-antitoxin module